jgi:hypothetical protein
MVKEIVKRIGVDSSEVAEVISEQVTDCIIVEVRDYLQRHYETLNDRDIDVILDSSEWWSDLLEDLIDRINK